MSDIRQAYENLRYPPYVHPLSDPAHLAVVGRLLGVAAADPASARVLDIGCGAATNLLAMAARLPGGRFHGIDFSAPDIAAGRAAVRAAGLTNVTLAVADLLDWEPGPETYDYIIAYGLFSWVPDAVKERLLAVIAKALAPDGIALVSYMTYPGCKTTEGLRDLLRLHTDTLHDPADRVAAAHRTLDMLDGAWAGAGPKVPHAAFMRAEVAGIRAKEPHYLLLDDLGVERDPCYLIQFAGWAAEHGLRYLGDSEFPTMLLENLPPASARALLAMGLDQLGTEQMLDYIVNRSFRASLLVAAGAAVRPGIDATQVRRLYLSPVLRVAGGPRGGGASGRFINERGGAVTLRGAPLVAFAQVLAGQVGFVGFADLLAAAEARASRTFTAGETAKLCEDLVTLYGRGELALSAIGFSPPSALPDTLRLTPLNRVLAAEHGMIVTATHHRIALDAAQRSVCALLTAPTTLADLRATASDMTPTALVRFVQMLAMTGCLQA